MQAAKEPLWLTHVNARNSPVDPLAIASTIESLAHTLSAQNSRVLDLACVDRSAPSPQHLVAILRTSFIFKETIVGWYALRDFGWAYLAKEGFVPDRVMKGLDVMPAGPHE